MKKLIFALVALVFGMCGVNANESQEGWCDDKSLSYCIRHFDKQCKSKNYLACAIVGDLYSEQEQYHESKKYFELVCDKANSKDSFQIELIDGNLSPKIPAIAPMQPACGELAKHYSNGWGVRQDSAKALQYFKKACGLGNANSCGLAGTKYLFGENIKKDLKLAKSYFEKSCEIESSFGCFWLGQIYHAGVGDVQKNLPKAKELFGKACDLGSQEGCDAYKELKGKGY